MFQKRYLATAVAAAAGLAASAPALAAPAQSRMLEEVVVTASKREQSVQDVAASVTAISGDMMDRAHAQDATDLNGIAPNVQLQPVGAFPNASAFFIRGVGSTDIESATDPGIAVFVDEVYQGRTSTALVDFLDIQSVEILRGPQGTLFGRNSVGGLVHVKHYEPQLDARTLDLGFEVGNYGRRDVEAVANLPVSDTLAFRVAAKSTNSDGMYDNEFNGNDLNGQDRITVLPSVLWAPTDNFDVLLRGEYNRIRDDGYANIPYNVCRSDPRTATPFASGNDLVIDFIAGVFGQPEAAASFCANEVDDDNFDVRHNQLGGNESEFDIWGGTIEANYRMPALGTFTYVGNYRSVEEDVPNDFDTTSFALFETRRQQDHWQTSQELRYTADLSPDFDLVAGTYYFAQNYELGQDLLGAFAGPAGQGFGNSQQLHTSWAVFSQLDYYLNEKLTVIAGLRYSEEEKDFDHCGVGSGNPVTRNCNVDIDGDGALENIQASGTESWSNVSPKLGVQYFVTPETMAYATWSRGFRSGGFNGRATSPTTIGPFDEEEANNYEIGVKSTLMGGMVQLNLAAFLLDYTDLQRAVIRPSPAGSGGQETVTENVGEAENKGVELELNAMPLPGLTANLTVGYLDAENKEFCAPLQGVSQTDAPPAGASQCAPTEVVTDSAGNTTGFLVPIDVSDLEPPQSPEWQVRLGLAYEHQLDNLGSVTFGGSYRYSSEVNLIGAGLPAGTTDGIVNYDGVHVTPERESNEVVDLNVVWRSVDQRYSVSGYVKNVFDEQYIATGTFVAGLFNFVQYNQPRHYGVELTMSLGD